MILLLGAALAQDLGVKVVRVVEEGKGSPTLTVTPVTPGKLDIRLTCGERAYSLLEVARPGVPVTLTLTGTQGTADCSGTLAFTDDAGGVGQMPLQFQVASLPPIAWSFSASDVDTGARTLSVGTSRPVVDARVEVYTTAGGEPEVVGADLADPSRPRFAWASTAEVLKLVVVAADANGFRSQLELSPWRYAIPHEDVVFASGRSDIPPDEERKLEATWSETRAVLEKYGAIVKIQLFVAGYTDTVGTPASNQALSEARARSIASWFRKRGFTGSIHYQGFGEDALAIQTADEVDQAENRRSVYLLAAQAPEPSAELPRAAWKPL